MCWAKKSERTLPGELEWAWGTMFQEAAASWMDGPPSGTALVSSPAPASASVSPLLREPTAVCADLESRAQVVYTTALWDVCEHPDFKDRVT